MHHNWLHETSTQSLISEADFTAHGTVNKGQLSENHIKHQIQTITSFHGLSN